MICFIVPVKSEQVSKDWRSFSNLFERTIKSICRQIDTDFEIIVACHEVPLTDFTHPKIHYLQVDFDPPKLTKNDPGIDDKLKEGDKARKILKAYEYANSKFEVDYFMVVDSDDCIHREISRFVNDRKENKGNGWVIKRGYFINEGSGLAWLNRNNFDLRCGSCLVVNREFFKNLIVEEPYLYYYHNNPELSNYLEPLPFAGAVYSMANGENHFMTSSTVNNMLHQPKLFSVGHIKSIISKIKRYRPRTIDDGFREEYNYYQILQ